MTGDLYIVNVRLLDHNKNICFICYIMSYRVLYIYRKFGINKKKLMGNKTRNCVIDEIVSKVKERNIMASSEYFDPKIETEEEIYKILLNWYCLKQQRHKLSIRKIKAEKDN